MGGSRLLRLRPLALLGLGIVASLALAPAAGAGVARAAAPATARASGSTAPGSAGARYDLTAWKRVWAGDFASRVGSGINQRRWHYDTGTGVFGTGEVETMTSARANVSVTGAGDLEITALDRDGDWTSGRVQTLRTFAAPAGGEMMVTATIRQPDPSSGMGYWPAFWMLGPGQFPENGEIDVMEDVNAQSEHSGTLHCGNLTEPNGDGTFGPCHEDIGLTSGFRPCPGCQTGYHTYSIVVDRRNAGDEQVRWYLDGQQFFAVSESQVGAAVWTQAIDHGLSILFDLAIGGGYPDSICACVTPTAQTSSGAMMSVRSVAVYDSVRLSWRLPSGRSSW
jgi:beta-glucanase (GH16 family)